MELTRRAFAGAGLSMLGAALAGGLAGCSNASTSAGSGAGASAEGSTTQVVVAMNAGSEPAAGFDPLIAWGCGEHVHEPLIQSTLITTDEHLEFVNDLATSYSCSDDGLVWTFNLRDDVRFSDGEPLTAEDVTFTVNSIIANPASEADLSMVDEAVALDDTTVELHLNKPFNALLYTLAVLGIVPAHAYGANYGEHPIGSGRYLLERWDRGQQAIFTANPDYYGEAPIMERVVVVFMEEDAALAAVAAGQVDIAFTYATHAGQSYPGYELVNYATVDSRGISLPCVPSGGQKTVEGDTVYEVGNDVTCENAVRRAINMAIDRDSMIDGVLSGFGKPAYSVSDGMPWSSDDMRVDFDRDAARSLLDEAGWSESDDGIRQKDGVRASFEVWYASDDSVRQAMANELSNQLADIGIEAQPRGGSWDEIYPNQYRQPVLWGWGSNSPIELYALNYSTGWGNYAGYESERIDGHLDDALARPDVASSYDDWKLAQWDGVDGFAPQGAASWAWIANVDHLYFKREGLDVAAQKPHPHGHGWSLVNNVDRWSWS
ncbi:ABC transporter substrate-binding protein [Collinsella sp. An2]|uniref:ABC transporter substrate-binding protein n=1 Tax=Collinsella sp. An2 TaxID=1965585 RepID=UPI001EF60FA9|nr:ABC transporter substrate-binding protein [Collinsella sp. An2]